MKPGGNRRKEEEVLQQNQRTTSLYRSVSSPVIVSSYEKYMERREEVVVGGGGGGGGGYGLPPLQQQQHSPDVASPSSPAINPGGYQERVSKGRKRPSRKTRQSSDGYGSSPDAHAISPPYPNADNMMKGGVNKTQAEHVDKEELLVQGTNNYASLLSSPSPSSIPNPSFTKKYAYDFPAGLLATSLSQASVSPQSPFANDSNYVQLMNPPPSPGFLSDSDINSVKMNTTTTTTTLGTLMSSMSPRLFNGSRRESLNSLGVLDHDDFSGNGYVAPIEPAAPVATLMPGFLSGLTSNSLETSSRASTQKDCSVDLSVSPHIDLDNGCLPNPSLSVDSPMTLTSEDDPAVKCLARQLPAIGVPKTKVKPASKTTKGTNDSMLLRRHGMPTMGPRQHPSEKGLKKVPLSGLPGSPPVNFACTVESRSHWKIVSVSSVQETSETPPSSVVSSGYNSNEELLGSPNGSRSCLLGSSYSSPRRSGTDGNQPGSTSVHSTSPAKLYLEHWSPEVVNRAMEEGRVFGATLRVNSHNRNEAYVTIDGIPRDILIDGSAAQNRAMEGDSVAVLLEQPSAWPRLKGGNNKQMSNEPRGLGEVVVKHSEAEKEMVQLSSRLGDIVPSSDGMQEQHALGLSSTDQAENMVRDLGANASVPQLLQRSKDVQHLNYLQKDPGVIGSPYWQESSTIKASICSTGQLDRQAEATHKMILQSPRRPSNESAPGIGHPQQNGLESKKEMGEGQQLSGGSGSVLALKQTENNVGVRCSNNADTNGKVATALANVVSLVMSLPGKRPAGKVVAILEKSFRWETVVGFLELPARAGSGPGRSHAFNVDDSPRKRRNLMLVPVDNRCPKMMVSVSRLPDDIRQRLWDGDSTVSNELLAARVDGWRADSHFPVAVVKQSLGQGGELEAQQRAILLEHAISSGKFSPASLACLPELPWKMPVSEMKRRKNLLHLRVFSVVRSTAQDCAHALSIESLPDGAVRVGMHVADVSYFVHPGTALDHEAQMRLTSVSCVQEVLPMLPRVLCKDLCSLNPAVDRLAFSVMWDMNDVGDITNEWIGRTVVHSCAKLTHGHVQTMMDEVFPDFEGIEPCEDMLGFETELPQIYGGHTWMDLVMDVRALHRIATKRRASRFEGGALELDQSKLVFALEEDGTPYESTMYNTKDSNLVVKEFMLLANMTVAHVISNAFPDSALLCCCPKPSPRKLKEFEDFCCKIGIDLDASSAGALSTSLRNMQESVKHDPVLYSILMQYAAKPMQSAKYFCSREFKEKEKWAHCRHAIPLYTHFTSPMQRYPDIIVHRTLAAALEAEEALGNMAVTNSNQARGILAAEKSKLGVPTETSSERGANSMPVSQWVLASVTMKHQLRGSSELISLAAWCNQRRMASRSVKEASIKLNIWTLLKKNKQGLLSNARVLALGPKFMSLYICKFAMEKRIYYEDIEGVSAEWFEATGTLVLDISSSKNTSQRRANQSRNGKPQRTVADIAMLVNPTDSSSSSPEQESFEDIIREVQERLAGKVFTDDVAPEISGGADQLASNADIEPTVFPLTLRSLSSVPVSLHAIGGDNRPLDVAARLYVSSYATSG